MFQLGGATHSVGKSDRGKRRLANLMSLDRKIRHGEDIKNTNVGKGYKEQEVVESFICLRHEMIRHIEEEL